MHVRVPIHCPKVIRVLRRPDKRSAIRQSCLIYCRMATRGVLSGLQIRCRNHLRLLRISFS
ncbi:hypothetical protein EHN61_16310 [Salmonella enterica]|uniref:Uncharacterized protein n=4 Tax=Salmonella enterica TaxID=28901 RepID=A0A3Y2QNU4_SALET|nr:hypothetical protein BWD35_23570 [Salmonella enterica subsp. enterica serovar Dublin str. ATCC 39184]AXD50177.1 hypothetical protein CHC30_23855 [Salmonella enterica]AYB04983.1 hypothetical protein D5G00_02050 [Salmonella enterica subsp. enterica serovar Dublin]EAW2027155.1 hypothetical protein [Salmonella enterica subsp. enterica]ECA3048525.1 hypothetical protein [Salmonella enterica subsp. enterica serovar Rostock]HAD6765044.1 hypothetical protein [Salmonella enterica subsp. enterica sero